MKIGEVHEHYGWCVQMGVREGEPYRMFQDEYGVISLIPLAVLEEEVEE